MVTSKTVDAAPSMREGPCINAEIEWIDAQ
jgi:hypothetical protein